MVRMTLEQALEIVEGAVEFEIDGYMENFETDKVFLSPRIKELETAIKKIRREIKLHA